MIADPITSRAQDISGSGIEDENVFFDLVSNGPGSQTLRKARVPNLPGITLTLSVKHDVTGQGRRRSTYRLDAKAPVGTLFSPGASTVPRSSSAYIVVDRLDDESQPTKALTDTCVAHLLNAFVLSKVEGTAFAVTTVLTDFLNGEP